MLSQGKAESINQSKLISYHQHFLTVCTGQTLETKCCQMISHLIPTLSFQVWRLLRAWTVKQKQKQKKLLYFCFQHTGFILWMFSVHTPMFFRCAFRPPLPLSPHHSLHFRFVCNCQEPIFRSLQFVEGVHYGVCCHCFILIRYICRGGQCLRPASHQGNVQCVYALVACLNLFVKGRF